MDRKQFEDYLNAVDNALITVDDMPGSEGTLVLGFTAERNSFHVYVAQGLIHTVVYDYTGTVLRQESDSAFPAAALAPTGKAYPERTDAAFAALMRARGHELDFMTFSHDRVMRPGEIVGQAITPATPAYLYGVLTG